MYIESTNSIPNLFTTHWSMIGWGIAFILMILLLTPLWKHIREVALGFAGIGWLCIIIARSGYWFLGWFGWTPFLSGIIFMRFLIEYTMNLPYIPETKNGDINETENN